MLENLYTTKMSASKKTLQNRFAKIRRKSGWGSKIMAAVMSCVLAAAMLGGAVVMAAVGNEEKNFFIDGKGYAIEPILIENRLATHTDNYFVPLRKTFEALGYKVSYDVDKAKYQNHMDKRYTFPVYDANVHIEFTDDYGYTFVSNENSFAWRKPLVTNDVDYYIYGATGGMNMQLPIIEMTKDGKTEYCQIGSRRYSNGYAIAPVLINGVAYIPLRIVATIVGGNDNVQWDDSKHDTYFEGVLNFDEPTKTITVSTSPDSTSKNYTKTIEQLNSNGNEVMQRQENRKYVFCLVNFANDEKHQTFLAVSKDNGTISELGKIDRNIAHLIHIMLPEGESDSASLYKQTPQAGESSQMALYGNYRINK